MRSQSAWVALMAALAVAAGVWLIAVQPAPDAAGPAPAAMSPAQSSTSMATALASPVARGGMGPQQAEPSVASAPVTAPTPATADPALPAVDVPLASVIDGLEARARAGDARAACRLAGELARCAGLPIRRAYSATHEDVHGTWDPRTTDRTIDAAARIELALEYDEQRCKGVSIERIRAATSFLLQAARAGQPAAQDAFLAGDWLTEPAVVRHPDAVAAFAREAERMARSLLESPTALSENQLLQFGMAFTGNPRFPHPLVEAVKPDPVLARALLGLGLEARAPTDPGASRSPGLLERTLADLDAQLTPAERLAAAATMDRLRPRVRTTEPARESLGSFVVPDPADCAR